MQAANPPKLWSRMWSLLLDEIGVGGAQDLIGTGSHTMRLSARRARVIATRVRLAAGLLAILTPLWIAVDVWMQPPAAWHELAAIRLATAVAFAFVPVVVRGTHTLRDAYRALLLLYAVAIAFMLIGYLRAAHGDAPGLAGPAAAGNAFLPITMIAVLAIFPLTVLESAGLAAAIVLAHASVLLVQGLPLVWPAFLPSLSLLLLVAALAALAAVSQLGYLMVNVREGIHDALTGCYSRRCGEELAELQYALSVRSESAFSLVLVGLDNFQDFNQRFGYAQGDAALKATTVVLHDALRSGDMLVRWTGDQYLLLMPGATADQADLAVQRLLSKGLGLRPDRAPFTASVGVAEMLKDASEDWWKLVDLAEARMREARKAGGNRTLTA